MTNLPTQVVGVTYSHITPPTDLRSLSSSAKVCHGAAYPPSTSRLPTPSPRNACLVSPHAGRRRRCALRPIPKPGEHRPRPSPIYPSRRVPENLPLHFVHAPSHHLKLLFLRRAGGSMIHKVWAMRPRALLGTRTATLPRPREHRVKHPLVFVVSAATSSAKDLRHPDLTPPPSPSPHQLRCSGPRRPRAARAAASPSCAPRPSHPPSPPRLAVAHVTTGPP
jgi:hypothetical protein